MLLHGDRPLREYQEGEDGKPPYHLAARDRYRCINCGRMCHRHGWRIRYVCLSEGRSVRIWVHRLRCPGCGMTYTVLPKWAHALKVHSLSVILSVINAYLREGHLVHSARSWVDLRLRRNWVRDFIKRHRKETGGLKVVPEGNGDYVNLSESSEALDMLARVFPVPVRNFRLPKRQMEDITACSLPMKVEERKDEDMPKSRGKRNKAAPAVKDQKDSSGNKR